MFYHVNHTTAVTYDKYTSHGITLIVFKQDEFIMKTSPSLDEY